MIVTAIVVKYNKDITRDITRDGCKNTICFAAVLF